MKPSERQPERGDVYLCVFEPARGSEQGGAATGVMKIQYFRAQFFCLDLFLLF